MSGGPSGVFMLYDFLVIGGTVKGLVLAEFAYLTYAAVYTYIFLSQFAWESGPTCEAPPIRGHLCIVSRVDIAYMNKDFIVQSDNSNLTF
jgi:hypothetical protein